MQKNLKPISPFRLSSLLRRQNEPSQALRLFQNPNPNSSSAKPFRHGALSYNLIISKLARAKLFPEMEHILLQMKQQRHRFIPKESLFCHVITCYGRARMSAAALRTFEQIPSFGSQRTVRSLNCLLSAFLNCREFDKIREVYPELDTYAVPDTCTYNILINACCLSKLLDGAWELFDEMRSKGIRPNVVTFGTLVSALCTNSKLDEAFKLKEEMENAFSVKPNAFIYTSLIKGLCKKNELDLAFKLKDEMLSDCKVGLDSAAYSTLISALYKVGRKGEVVGVLEEMRRNGCEPDTVTYNAMIAGFCNDKEFDSAFSVLHEMREKGCKPDVLSYNTIIAGFCRESRLRDACDLFEDMPRQECFPDVVSYRTLFDGLCNVLEYQEAACILDEMQFKGYKPCFESVQKLVKRLCKDGNVELLVSVFNSLAKGNSVDRDTWKMVIDILCQNATAYHWFAARKAVEQLRVVRPAEQACFLKAELDELDL
ncbi:hypothetical protein ACLOJK_008709 [Asimina triloba]